MNGKNAKALRKTVYGNFSSRNIGTKYRRFPDGTIMATGRRKIYQQAKKTMRNATRDPERPKKGYVRVPRWLDKSRRIKGKC